jgi:hypothetical protein
MGFGYLFASLLGASWRRSWNVKFSKPARVIIRPIRTLMAFDPGRHGRAEAHIHREPVRTGLANRRGHDLVDPKGESDLRDLTEHLDGAGVREVAQIRFPAAENCDVVQPPRFIAADDVSIVSELSLVS